MNIIPVPKRLSKGEGSFFIEYNSRIVLEAGLPNIIYEYAKLLNEEIKKELGYELQISKVSKTEIKDKYIHENGYPKVILLRFDKASKEDVYSLIVREGYIELTGQREKELLYAIQTLRQVIRGKKAIIPCMIIEDWPDIANRGYYFDVTRGRVPSLESLKKLADTLSYFKYNQLQLYVEHSYLFDGFSEIWRDDTPLTGDEIIELDLYCQKLNIDLVPSLSVFGHMYKVLQSKSFEHLCECPESTCESFSFDDRMAHHTLNVSDQESLELAKQMINEFLPLFTSKNFNICADETFDLGKGRSKALADEVGVKAMYIQYVKDLCEFVIEQGRRPMFWGDVIVSFPEAVSQLPEEVICLNWGYSPHELDNNAKAMYEAGATQYLCPGVGGWNQFINLYESAYNNILRMCTYGKKYRAIGILTTDWGDYGHINHPEFSEIPLIYAGHYGWSSQHLSFQVLNEMISRLWFGDESGKIVDILSRSSVPLAFEWRDVVQHKEKGVKTALNLENVEKVPKVIETLMDVKKSIYEHLQNIDKDRRSMMTAYLVALDGMILWNKVLCKIAQEEKIVKGIVQESATQVAQELETWFYWFKKVWRSVSKESELYRVQEVINWYADYLRSSSEKG